MQAGLKKHTVPEKGSATIYTATEESPAQDLSVAPSTYQATPDSSILYLRPSQIRPPSFSHSLSMVPHHMSVTPALRGPMLCCPDQPPFQIPSASGPAQDTSHLGEGGRAW